jgi:hypothetical protein
MNLTRTGPKRDAALLPPRQILVMFLGAAMVCRNHIWNEASVAFLNEVIPPSYLSTAKVTVP